MNPIKRNKFSRNKTTKSSKKLSIFLRNDRKKTEITGISTNNSTTIGTKISPPPPPASSPVPPVSHESANKGSQEYIPPFISSINSVYMQPIGICTNSPSHHGDSPPIATTTTETNWVNNDAEPVLVSKQACQVLEIIMRKQYFKNAAATETENELIRLYFAGKIPIGREREAQQILEKAVNLAVTRVKTSGLTPDLYHFLNRNRDNAISLIIDAMKNRKKEFLPDFWIYNRTN